MRVCLVLAGELLSDSRKGIASDPSTYTPPIYTHLSCVYTYTHTYIVCTPVFTHLLYVQLSRIQTFTCTCCIICGESMLSSDRGPDYYFYYYYSMLSSDRGAGRGVRGPNSWHLAPGSTVGTLPFSFRYFCM